MARQKKIVRYVPQTKIPEEGWVILWNDRANYSFDDLFGWAKTDMPQESLEYYNQRFDEHDGIIRNEWRNKNTWDKPAYSLIRSLHQEAWRNSPHFKNVNDAFLAEYDSREDMQEIYKMFFAELQYTYDASGKCYSRKSYNPESEGNKADANFFETYAERPKDYRVWECVVGHWNAKSYIEKNRETPFEEGDLVRLRDPYVSHPDHDPLWISRYEQARDGKTIPDRSNARIGTVMKVTNNVPWRASKGSKEIEILWFGKESTVNVPEKVLKWMERPTKKNGLLK